MLVIQFVKFEEGNYRYLKYRLERKQNNNYGTLGFSVVNLFSKYKLLMTWSKRGRVQVRN